MKFGIYHLNYSFENTVISSLEKMYGAEISFLSFYRAWNNCNIEDDINWLNWVLSSSKEILLTWEPWLISPASETPEKQPSFSLKNITSGKYDSYIRAFASVLAIGGRPVFLRPLHEMNGSWYPWCGTINYNNPEYFLDAWYHIKALFAEVGASNVRWVWSPYTSSYPDTSENKICNYFPGDEQIDLVALDGYNWGTSTDWGIWQSFSDLFRSGYDVVTAISTKPVIIGEIGCTEFGGRKSEWINDMFTVLSSHFGRIKAIIWFDIKKECDWRIASSVSALNAFKSNAQNLFGVHS